MTKEIWINLPVKNVKRSKEFFISLGFSVNEKMSGENSACIVIGSKNMAVMLFEESIFKGFTQHPLVDTKQGSEVLISFDVDDRAEVDEVAKKAADAGGTVFGKPAENQGWMYGCAFSDLDGHRWNALYMDFSKTPKG